MQNNNIRYPQIQKNIEKLAMFEKYREEKHDNTRIIFNSEISLLQAYQNVINNTAFTYKNRVPEEGTKLIKMLSTIKRTKVIGSLIQWIGVFMYALFAYLIFGCNLKEWNDNVKVPVMLFLFFTPIVCFFVGGLIRCSGRKYMADYIEVWNTFANIKGPIEINCLNNGQLAIIKYENRDKTQGKYLSALNADDTIWQGGVFDWLFFPTYVQYIYIIDSVKSCTRTKNGLMLESSGVFYGRRAAIRRNIRGHNKGDVHMKRASILKIIIGVIIVGALGAALFFWISESNKDHDISFDFVFDDFTFMSFSLGEGDRMTAIMEQNNIQMSEGATNSKDYYVEQSRGTKQVMCPANNGDRKGWTSAYGVCTDSGDGRISMCIDKTQNEYESYYKGPIQIGDSFEELYEYLSIDDIKKYGSVEEKNNRIYYTCESNLGLFTFKEEPYPGLDDLKKYKNTKTYLEAGNTISYCFRFDKYYMNITVDENLTVSIIAITYDPNDVLDDAELLF